MKTKGATNKLYIMNKLLNTAKKHSATAYCSGKKVPSVISNLVEVVEERCVGGRAQTLSVDHIKQEGVRRKWQGVH